MLQDKIHNFEVISAKKEQFCISTNSFGLCFVLEIGLQTLMEKIVGIDKEKIYGTSITDIFSYDTPNIASRALDAECEPITTSRHEQDQ